MAYAFSDGSPFAELAIFLLTFLASVGLFQWRRAAQLLDRSMTATAGFVRRRLFTVDDPDIEQRRLDLLRIVLGLMIVVRNYGNLVTAVQLDNSITIAATATATILSLFILIGFAVPVTAFVLGVLLNVILDNVAQTSSLSSIIVSMSLIPFALAPAGRSLSVDALIMRTNGPMGHFWRSAYEWWGPLTLDRAALAKFALLLAYGAISLSSGLLHLQFEVWRKGLTNSWMFINPVANPHFHDIMLNLYAFSPSIYVFLTKLSAYGTLAFQLALVPLLLLNRWTKYLVIILELGFVIGSVTLLALKWLGWVQLALCGILFWNRWNLNLGGAQRVSIFYDDKNDTTFRLRKPLAATDLFKIVEFFPLSLNGEIARAKGLSSTGLHGIDVRGHVTSGYDLYVLLSRRIVLLFPLWPIVWLGKVTGLGPAILVATSGRSGPRNGGPVAASFASRVTAPNLSGFNGIFRGFALTFLVMLTAYAVRLPVLPYLPSIAPAAAASKIAVGQAPLALGLFQINAFNFAPIAGPMFSAEMTWTKSGSAAEEPVMWIPPVKADIPVSDILFYQVVVAFNMFSDNGFCFSKEFMTNLTNRPGVRAVLNQQRFNDGEFHVRLSAYQVPSLADFDAKRFVPLRWQNICEATFPSHAPAQMSFTYFEDGIRLLSNRSPLPFKVSFAAVPAVMNFPCKAEAARVAYWFDRGQLADAAAALPLVQQFMQRTAGTSPPLCLAVALKVEQALDTNWRPDHLPQAGVTCEADLGAARAFVEGMAGSEGFLVAKARLLAAETASASGDQSGCLIAASDVRRAYYRWLKST